jgi:rRNA-processing protein FCF1
VKINIYEELDRLLLGDYKILIYSALFQELERKLLSIPPQNKLHREYRLSKSLLGIHLHEIIEKIPLDKQDVDDFLIDEAISIQKEYNIIYIATNDKKLRSKCEKQNIHTIFLRNGNRLEIK